MDRIYYLPTYDEFDQYGFGSWLKGNIGNIAQTVGGAILLASSPLTGPAGLAGAGMLASGVGGFGNSAMQSSAEKQNEEDALAAKKNALAQNRLQGLDNSANIPTFKKGGHLPEGRATLKEAKEFISQFPDEMKMGEEVEYEHTGNQKLAQRIAADHVKDYLKMTGTPGYYSAMKEAGISDELNKMEKGGYFEYKNGGIYIKPSKRGSFTAWAKKHGMGVQEAASKVMAHKENYSSSVVKKANFAKNASKWKHDLGGKLENIPDMNILALGGDIGKIPGSSLQGYFKYGGENAFQIDGFEKGGNIQVAKPLDTNMVPVSPTTRQNVTPMNYGPAPSLEDLGVNPNNYKSADLTALNLNREKSLGRAIPERYRATVPAKSENNVPYLLNSYSMDRNIVPNTYVVNRGNESWNMTYDPVSGKLNKNTSDLEMRQRTDMAARKNMSAKTYNEWKKTQSRVSYATGGFGVDNAHNGLGKDNGTIETNFLTEYKTGGTHEQNPYGGIPVGGKARVEQGEYRFDDPETGESYIFSNRF